MSITDAMTSAVSGLTATARQAGVLSANVANATTPGYARREVELSSDVNGQGVRVTGVTRKVDSFLEANRRAANSEVKQYTVKTNFLLSLENILGTPESEGSLVARVADLEAAFIVAASRPESEPNLIAVANAAKSLSNSLNVASDALQAQRVQADKAISFAVDKLNFGLSQVQKLNTTIQSYNATGRDVSALLDQRAGVIDEISSLVPVQQLSRANGAIALISASGAVLLDGKAAEVGFTTTSMITPEMTIQTGALSALTLNGSIIPSSGSASLIAGGELGAYFDIRDNLAVEGQGRLDALARDLIERMQSVEPDLPSSAPALFTDQGQKFDPLNETGIASRISLNKLVDSVEGSSVSRLRDGLTGSGSGIGNSSLLSDYSAALSSARETSSSSLSTARRSLSGLASDVLSLASVQRLNEERQLSFSNTRLSSLLDLEKANAVNLDTEIQSLLVIEKAYAANSKVLQALNDMLDQLLRI